MASISCQHIYKIYPGATAPSVTDFNLVDFVPTPKAMELVPVAPSL